MLTTDDLLPPRHPAVAAALTHCPSLIRGGARELHVGDLGSMLLDDLSDFPAIDTGSAAGTYLIRTFSDRDFTEQQVMALRAELDGNLRLVTCFAGEAVGVFEQVEHLSRIIHLLPRTVSPP